MNGLVGGLSGWYQQHALAVFWAKPYIVGIFAALLLLLVKKLNPEKEWGVSPRYIILNL